MENLAERDGLPLTTAEEREQAERSTNNGSLLANPLPIPMFCPTRMPTSSSAPNVMPSSHLAPFHHRYRGEDTRSYCKIRLGLASAIALQGGREKARLHAKFFQSTF